MAMKKVQSQSCYVIKIDLLCHFDRNVLVMNSWCSEHRARHLVPPHLHASDVHFVISSVLVIYCLGTAYRSGLNRKQLEYD